MPRNLVLFDLEWNIGYYRADSFVYTLEFEREV